MRAISRLGEENVDPTNGSSTDRHKKPGPAAKIPKKTNAGLEEALAMAGGNQHELAKRIGGSVSNITISRRRGTLSGDMAIRLFLTMRVKLTKLLGQEVRCPHCHKDI